MSAAGSRFFLHNLPSETLASMTNCKKCASEIDHNFCGQCGHPAQLKSIDHHYVSHELLHLLHFEKGFLFNAKELFLRPGNSIRMFIKEDRTKHMKPIAFLIFCALLYTFVYNYFKPAGSAHAAETTETQSTVAVMQHWVTTHFGYAYVLISVFLAFWTKVFFRKQGYNFYEIITLLCFILGQGLLLTMVVLPFVGILNNYVFAAIAISTTMIYPTFAIGQFFGSRKAINYVKAAVVFLLGNLSFYLTVLLIGTAIDYAKSIL
ncbi:MAG: hypothetical protein CFE23_11675 [Flavobacterium sp. BFFFF1]|nr:MAG: hypothetical protein CFE23_11675 [Flavobacterium sp. BFFFF1]